MATEQQFGGRWTQAKLGILKDYLRVYCTALQRQSFRLHYADAFAGTGRLVPKAPKGQESLLPQNYYDGSVRIALGTEPSFHKYHFNDSNPDHVNKIKRIAEKEFPEKADRVRAVKKDANEFVEEFCQLLTYRDRAVVFLDPFGAQVNWKTLEHVAKTKKIDLWLLFPFLAILRMTPRNQEQVKPEWSRKITLLLGTNEWETALYRKNERLHAVDLFGGTDGDDGDNTAGERVNVMELGTWITQKLRSIFAHVPNPVELTQRNRPLFLFYFAVSNDEPKAVRLADKIVKPIMRKHGGSP